MKKMVLAVLILVATSVLGQNWVPAENGLQIIENVWPMVIPNLVGVAQFNVAICAGQLSAKGDEFNLDMPTPYGADYGNYTAHWVKGPKYQTVTFPDGTSVTRVSGILLGNYRPTLGTIHFHNPQDNVYAYFSDTMEDTIPGGPQTLGCGNVNIVFVPNQVIQ